MPQTSFEWDDSKDRANREKHGIGFAQAQEAFFDPRRVIARDLGHSTPREARYFCFGRVGDAIVTVRCTYRQGSIRIFGAGYWRKGKAIYDRENG